MKRLSIVAVLTLAVSATAAAESLSRAEAVARALRSNPDVQKSLEDRRRLDGIILEARADALPELTLYGSWNRYRDPGLLNSSSFDAFPPELRDSLTPVPANLYEGQAALKQTLFSFKLGHAIKAAKFGRSFGEEEIRRVQQAVALRAVRAYDGYLLAIEKVKVGAKAVVQKEKHLEQADSRYTSGVATELDVLRSKVDLENQRTALLRFQGEAELARGNLNAVMMRPIETPLEPTDHLEYRPVTVDVAQAVHIAWENRPEAKAVALQEKIQHELVGVAKSEARPSLDFNGSYGWSVREPSNFLESDFKKWNAGVVLKIPIFDGLRTAGKVAQAESERNKVGQDRLALENQIRLEAKNAVDVLNVAKSVYEAAELNVSQADKALQMTQANYNYGAATLLDVLDAQAALTLAESNRVEALFSHGIARAALRYTMAQDPLEPAATEASEGNPR
jgi:HAE1 family hydrophobic/amphiphilic exporter-1